MKTQTLLKNILLVIIFIVSMYFVVQYFSKTIEEEPTNNNSNNNVENIMENKKVEIEVLKEGEGDVVSKNGDTLAVHYTGTLENGEKFDSSLDRGTPFEFELGSHSVIEGWEQGMLGMKVNEKRKLLIPYELAYGENGYAPVIPPKANLIFEVELLEIK